MRLTISIGKKCLLLLFLILCLSYPDVIEARQQTLPFKQGERLVFQLRWSFVPAGEAVMEVLPNGVINGTEALHFLLTAKSNSFVDAFYKVRDRIDAFTDMSMTHSLLYLKKQLEGSTHRDVVVTFDHSRKKAQYTNFEEKQKPITIMDGAFDPLSAFYFIRGLDMAAGSSIERAITDGKKSVIGRVRVVKKEKIKVKAGTFDTWLIEPDLKHVGGVFKKSKNAKLHIWVTADSRRIPVKIKSKVAVGSFVGELVSVTMPKQPKSKSVDG